MGPPAAQYGKGTVIQRKFHDPKTGRVRNYEGRVKKIEADGDTWFYFVRYEDGDSEHIPENEMHECVIEEVVAEQKKHARKKQTEKKKETEKKKAKKKRKRRLLIPASIEPPPAHALMNERDEQQEVITPEEITHVESTVIEGNAKEDYTEITGQEPPTLTNGPITADDFKPELMEGPPRKRTKIDDKPSSCCIS